jgi:hypothetical protein
MNNDDINIRHDGEELPAPPKLVAAFKELPARRVFVPPTVDEAVLRAARRHLAPPQRSGFNPLRFWLQWPVAAAACIVLIGLVYFVARPGGKNFAYAREDINHDGQVNILDAFQLARQLRSDRKPASGLDLNGDGVVDERDVEIIAARAVKLEKGGQS